MSKRDVFLFIVLGFFFQGTLMKIFTAGNTAPDLLLCSIIAGLFFYGNTGFIMASGLTAAMLKDLCFSQYAGPGAAAVFTVAVLSVYCKRNIRWGTPFFLLPFTAGVTLIHNLIIWFGEKLMGSPYSFSYILKLQPGYMLFNLSVIGAVYLFWIRKMERGRI